MLEGEDDGPIHEIDFDDGGNNGGQGEECCFTEAELEIAKEGTTSPPAKAMHEERRGPFFKEIMLMMKPFSIILVINLPSSTANFACQRPPRNDQATVAATTTATTTVPTTAAQS